MKLFCARMGANTINLIQFMQCNDYMITTRICAFPIFSRIVFVDNENSWIVFVLLDALMAMGIIFRTIFKYAICLFEKFLTGRGGPVAGEEEAEPRMFYHILFVLFGIFVDVF